MQGVEGLAKRVSGAPTGRHPAKPKVAQGGPADTIAFPLREKRVLGPGRTPS